MPPPADTIMCTTLYRICPPGQQSIKNGCTQSCVPCPQRSPPKCLNGYTASLNTVENVCPSYTCVPPITTLPIEA